MIARRSSRSDFRAEANGSLKIRVILEVRPLELNQPLMAHRHLSEVAGRELTKAAIDDIITRGTISTWRKLIQAMNADKTGRIARRAIDVAQTLGKHLSEYKGIVAPWNNWRAVQAQCASLSAALIAPPRV
jgi:hypothetical protein